MRAVAAPVGPARRRRRHPAVLLTLLLLGLVAAALLLELAFRLLWEPPPAFRDLQQAGMYVATADRDVALQPGYRGTLRVDVDTTVAIDALGMRDREFAPKAAGERRLLVLGDSMVWGYGVDVEQALPAQLQRALAARGEPWTVGNGGVPGYGSKHVSQHQARLDEPFGAEAFVVCGCLGNDPLDDLAPERTVYAGLMVQGTFARLVHASWRARLAYRSRAALWLESWLIAQKPEWSVLALVPPDPEEAAARRGLPLGREFAGLFLDAADDLVTWEPGTGPVLPRLLDRLRTSLRTMQVRAGLRPLVFVVLPTSWQVQEQKRQDKLRELGFAVVDFPRGKAQQRWLAVASELGIPAYDATPVLAGDEDPASLFVSDGGHFSARGHAVVAAWLAERTAELLAR